MEHTTVVRLHCEAARDACVTSKRGQRGMMMRSCGCGRAMSRKPSNQACERSLARIAKLGALSTSTTEPSVAERRAEKRRQRMEDNVNFAIENDDFKSTPKQQAICAASFGLTSLCAAEALSSVSSVSDASELALAALGAYVLSDLGSGVFHWSVDNYGGRETPIVGGVIEAFQGHHREPWTITLREFCNNSFKTCIPTLPFLVLCATDVQHPNSQMFWSLFSAFICLSQQFHAWSHMQKSELPLLVQQLQSAGVIINRKAHNAHHREPFENNYCIVSGMCNETLDNSGVLQWMEQRIFEATGVEPRCWVEEENQDQQHQH